MAGGASPTPALLSKMSLLTKMASQTEHRLEEICQLKVKALKNHMLFMANLEELDKSGRDAASRVRKDAKYKILGACSNHLSSSATLFGEIRAWETAHEEDMAASRENPAAENTVLTIDVVGKLSNRAPCERDTIFTDCLEHRAAELRNMLNDLSGNLKMVSKGLFEGGHSDWKATLSPTAPIAAVLAKASGSLLLIPMDALKASLASAEKAGKNS